MIGVENRPCKTVAKASTNDLVDIDLSAQF